MWATLPVVLIAASSLFLLARAQDASYNGTNEIQWFFGAPYTALYIGEGDTVKWRWTQAGPFSVEAYGSSSGMFTGKGGGTALASGVNFTYSYTFTKSGKFYFRDHGHPYVMMGEVNVKPKLRSLLASCVSVLKATELADPIQGRKTRNRIQGHPDLNLYDNFGGITLPWFLGISYTGASAIIEEGDTVTWQWSDDLPHALTVLDGNQKVFGPGPGTNNDTISGEGTFTHKQTFKKAGIYLYKCQNHGAQMQGNITVLPKGSSKKILAGSTPSTKQQGTVPAATVPPPPSSKLSPPASKTGTTTTKSPSKGKTVKGSPPPPLKKPTTKTPSPASTKTKTPATSKTSTTTKPTSTTGSKPTNTTTKPSTVPKASTSKLNTTATTSTTPTKSKKLRRR